MDQTTILALADAVRKLAMRNAPIVDMLRLIQERAGTKRATFEAILVMREVFSAPLYELKCLGTWVGFESGNPGLPDGEIERRWGEKIRATLRHDDRGGA